MALSLKQTPRKVLMIKSHSMGIGDILRSSAAWRAMKNAWPDVELHLLFLSRHAGYPSEALIRQHHLLSSANFLTIREGVPYGNSVRKVSNLQVWGEVWRLAKQIKPDWVIDFEWAGSRTSVVSLISRWASGAHNLGIRQFPMRSLFYSHTAPSTADFIQKHGLTEPFDYTLRDFVVLDALGIERGDTSIELKTTSMAKQWADAHLPVTTHRLKVGLNIGCATFGASHKRMPLDQLATHFNAWMQIQPMEVMLTGAPNESEINEAFLQELVKLQMDVSHCHNMAGLTDMQTLPALIEACDVFVTTDSGPYHMAVALKKPTLCWLMHDEKTSYHRHPWVRCLVQPDDVQFSTAVKQLTSNGM
jgi:ADP-heptose:LPS heptosyltransferase